jgi:ornithine cyclodeaminase/alanine dehydrogenase-like protein (mu-crystallin family)
MRIQDCRHFFTDHAIRSGAEILARANAVSVARRNHQATRLGLLDDVKPVELGNLILDEELRRSSDCQLTVADLTGVAVQDLQISKAIYRALS